MKLRRDGNSLLTWLASMTTDSAWTDLSVICEDGTVQVPKLLLVSLMIQSENTKGVLEALSESDALLVLPKVKSSHVLTLLDCLLGRSECVEEDDIWELMTLLLQFSPLSRPNSFPLSSIIKHEEQDAEDETLSEDDKKFISPPQAVTRAVSIRTITPSLVDVEAAKDSNMTLLPPPCDGATLGKKRRRCECSLCGKSLYDKHSLKKHEDTVHFNIRPHECQFCLKRFSVKNDLKDHIQAVHAKVKACICDICGLGLATRHGLRTHKLVHQDNSKAISCVHCHKTFRHMCTYRKHIARVHEFSAEKRLQCKTCGKHYNHQEGLTRHAKKFHSGVDKQFTCSVCQAAFAFNYDLNRHKKRFHGEKKPNAVDAQPESVLALNPMLDAIQVEYVLDAGEQCNLQRHSDQLQGMLYQH